MAMMVLLQSPQAEVLGITMVSGDAWEPEEVTAHAAYAGADHRPDVPVVPGAIFPLVRIRAGVESSRGSCTAALPGTAHGETLRAKTSREPYHGPYVIPKTGRG